MSVPKMDTQIQIQKQTRAEEADLVVELSPDCWGYIAHFLSDKDKFSVSQVSHRANLGVKTQSIARAHRLCQLFSLVHPHFRTSLNDADLSQKAERVRIQKMPKGFEILSLHDSFVVRLKKVCEESGILRQCVTGLQAQNPVWVSRALSEASLVYDKALDQLISQLSSEVPEEFQKKLAQIPPCEDMARHEEIEKIFREIATLPLLELSLKELPLIPRELFLLTNLEKLWISNGTFRTIPREIGNLQNLRFLLMERNCELRLLPSEIGLLGNLEHFTVVKNKVATLPPEIGNLRNLRYLFLFQNQLISIPPQIGDLSELRQLELQENRLTTLPPEIGRLVHLGYVNVKGNPIKSIPQEIRNLRSLKIFEDLKICFDDPKARFPVECSLM